MDGKLDAQEPIARFGAIFPAADMGRVPERSPRPVYGSDLTIWLPVLRNGQRFFPMPPPEHGAQLTARFKTAWLSRETGAQQKALRQNAGPTIAPELHPTGI